jgi:hypothetical protein
MPKPYEDTKSYFSINRVDLTPVLTTKERDEKSRRYSKAHNLFAHGIAWEMKKNGKL